MSFSSWYPKKWKWTFPKNGRWIIPLWKFSRLRANYQGFPPCSDILSMKLICLFSITGWKNNIIVLQAIREASIVGVSRNDCQLVCRNASCSWCAMFCRSTISVSAPMPTVAMAMPWKKIIKNKYHEYKIQWKFYVPRLVVVTVILPN